MQFELAALGGGHAQGRAHLHEALEIGAQGLEPAGDGHDHVEHGPRGFVGPGIGRHVGRLDCQVHIGVGVLEGVGDEVRSRLDTLAEGVCLSLRHDTDGGGIAGDGVPALAAVQGCEAEGSLLEGLAQCPCHHLDGVRAALFDVGTGMTAFAAARSDG